MTNQIQNPKLETKTARTISFRSFDHSNLIRHSGFEFRISQGFTFVELLVVIGIIIILVGILLPVIGKIRYAAYNADTQNEISQISNACSSYYSTYHAYPGPFSNDDIGGGLGRTNGYQGSGSNASAGPATLTYYYFGGNYVAIPNMPWAVTGAENLVLGLMGGLRVDTVAAGQRQTISRLLLPKSALAL